MDLKLVRIGGEFQYPEHFPAQVAPGADLPPGFGRTLGDGVRHCRDIRWWSRFSEHVLRDVPGLTPCLLVSSLVYSWVLGGTIGQLGTTQTPGRPYAQNPSSRAHLVRGAEPL